MADPLNSASTIGVIVVVVSWFMMGTSEAFSTRIVSTVIAGVLAFVISYVGVRLLNSRRQGETTDDDVR